MEELLYSLFGLACQCLIPAAVGYCWQMSLLNAGRAPNGRIKLRRIILLELAILMSAVVGMHLIPALEETCAFVYFSAFFAVVITAGFSFGRWAARSDFRRKQK